MKSFQFIHAQSVEAAGQLTRKGGGVLHAGGIDLLGRLKDGLEEPKQVVDVKSVPGLDAIDSDGQGWSIGANVKLARLAAHEGVRKSLPGLAEAAAEVGSPQIRNMATVGGNLAQHSRCWYYRHPDVRCLKNGGARCYAHDGENKYHSLYTNNPCISPVVSNLAVALAALGGTVTVQRRRGTEDWSIEELFADAWENPRAHHSLDAGDVITGIRVPAVPGLRSHYLQISEKGDFDWALVSCAASARVNGGRLSDVRVALGAIAPGPWMPDGAAAGLEGRSLDDDLAAAVAERMLAEAEPREHNAYKIPMAKALVKRTLRALVA